MQIKNSNTPRQSIAAFHSTPEFYNYFITKQVKREVKEKDYITEKEHQKIATTEKRIQTRKYPRKLYASVVGDFNKAIRDEMSNLGFEWNAFGRLGKLAVYKYKPEIKRLENGRLNLPINPKRTAALWREKPELKHKKYVYHLNEHSDGYVCKIFWLKFKGDNMFHNQHFIMFTPNQKFSRSVYQAIVKNQSHENYFIFEQLNKE